MKKIFISLIEIYQQYLSFDRGLLRIFAPFGACRYYPTCSEYTKQAILKHGLWQGSYLGLKRILMCNPWIGAS